MRRGALHILQKDPLPRLPRRSLFRNSLHTPQACTGGVAVHVHCPGGAIGHSDFLLVKCNTHTTPAEPSCGVETNNVRMLNRLMGSSCYMPRHSLQSVWRADYNLQHLHQLAQQPHSEHGRAPAWQHCCDSSVTCQQYGGG